MSIQAYTHAPVMLQEVMHYLNVKPNGIYLDGTFGRGGHSKEILAALGTAGRLVAFDKDPDAVVAANSFSDERLQVVQTGFESLKAFAEQADLMGRIDGILLDIGVSSPQLDDAARGFSFMRDGPLDMRMDTTQGVTAADWIRSATDTEIADVLFQFGEERYSRRIGRAIVEARGEQPITTTLQLAEIVKKAHPRWPKGQHPATRSFQGIRIFINQELAALQMALPQAMEALAIGGRLVVMSFHSLEDRVVKRTVRDYARSISRWQGATQDDTLAVKKLCKAVKATEEEVQRNPRARSATLRAVERIR